jgi:hypothetical protein
VTARGLAKSIGQCLDSQRAQEVVGDSFGPGGNRILQESGYMSRLGLWSS